MKGADASMATRGRNMPYTTGYNRYFSIEYSDLDAVPRVFLDTGNTLNMPTYTTIYLPKTSQSAYVDRQLVRRFPNERFHAKPAVKVENHSATIHNLMQDFGMW